MCTSCRAVGLSDRTATIGDSSTARPLPAYRRPWSCVSYNSLRYSSLAPTDWECDECPVAGVPRWYGQLAEAVRHLSLASHVYGSLSTPLSQTGSTIIVPTPN